MDDLDTPRSNEEKRPLEKSPQERYVRFETRLGSGAYKTVYKAYDTDQGIDVAWNAIDIASLPAGEKARIIQEVQLLQKLEHKNIINFYGSWFSKEKNQVVFITEIMTSGTLKSYIKRVQFVKLKIIKRWCIQILEGLDYLHSQSPPIIHRDLKCDNIFINGNTGDLRIGDLGLSTQMAVTQRAQSVLGTPEFMAPELYDENYDEKVDIYAFGMCVLEMMTKDVPYSECMNPAQIYKKVIAGIRPKGLQRIISDSARDFIELCLSRGDGKIDVTAKYLMNHPFLQASKYDDDHDLARPADEEDLPSIEQEKEPSHEEMSHELNMEDNLSGTAARRSSVPVAVSNTEVIIEPISDESKDDDAADEILAAMPGNESKVQDERVNVMVGRGKRMKTTSTGRVRSMVSNHASTQHAGSRQHAASVSEISSQEILPPRPTKLPAAAKSPACDVPRSKTPPPMGRPQAITTSSSVSSSPSAGNSPSAGDDPQPTKVVDGTTRRRSQRHDIKSTNDPDNEHSILLNLRIMIDGKSKEIKFSFNLFTDVPHEVASELAADVGIPEPEVAPIVDSICYLVTEGKIKNLTQMDFDVWEDAPEPHSFSLKKLAPSKKDVKKENQASIPLSRSILEQGVVGASESNSRNTTTGAFDQNDLEAAIRNEEEKHQREMVRYRLKMEEFERKKQQAAIARQQRMEQVGAEFKAEVQAERSKWPERISNTAGMNPIPASKPPSNASLGQDTPST